MRIHGRYKSFSLLFLLLAVLLLGTVLSYQATLRIAASQRMVTHTYDVMEALDSLVLTLQRSQGTAQDFVATGQNDYLTAYRIASLRLPAAVEAVRALTIDNPAQQDALAKIGPRIKQFKSELDRATASRVGGTVAPLTGDHQREIVTELRIMRSRESGLLAERSVEAAHSLTITRLGLLMGALLNGILLVMVAFVLVRDEEQRRQIRESKLRLAEIVNSSDDAVIGKKLDGTITNWNRGAERLYGYKPEEMIGKPIFAIVPPEKTAELRNVLKRLAEGDRVEHLETMRIRRDGTKVEVELTVSPVIDAHGKVTGASAIGRDITERKRLERSLHELSIRILRAQDEERRRIAREIHDTTVQKLALLSMNLAQLRAAPDSAKAQAIMESSQELTQECVQELRTLSYVLHPPMLDELGLASALKIYAEGVSQRSGLAIATEFEPGLPRLESDSEMALFRVAQESLSNVLRHSGSKTALLRLANRNGVEMKIIDRGRGIAGKPLDTDAPIGVGIAGMNERISQLGGILMIDSGPQGTTVTVRVPARKAAHA